MSPVSPVSPVCVPVSPVQKLKHTESDKLQVQIQAYLDNVFDVGALLEDAETKNAALERVEELEENLSHVSDPRCHTDSRGLGGASLGKSLGIAGKNSELGKILCFQEGSRGTGSCAQVEERGELMYMENSNSSAEQA